MANIIKTTGGKAGSVLTHKNAQGKALANASKKTVNHGSAHMEKSHAHGLNDTGIKGMHLKHVPA